MPSFSSVSNVTISPGKGVLNFGTLCFFENEHLAWKTCGGAVRPHLLSLRPPRIAFVRGSPVCIFQLWQATRREITNEPAAMGTKSNKNFAKPSHDINLQKRPLLLSEWDKKRPDERKDKTSRYPKIVWFKAPEVRFRSGDQVLSTWSGFKHQPLLDTLFTDVTLLDVQLMCFFFHKQKINFLAFNNVALIAFDLCFQIDQQLNNKKKRSAVPQLARWPTVPCAQVVRFCKLESSAKLTSMSAFLSFNRVNFCAFSPFRLFDCLWEWLLLLQIFF